MMASRDIQALKKPTDAAKATTPIGKRPKTLAPFTPTTANRNIDTLIAERDELVEFRKLECVSLSGESVEPESAVIQQSLIDSNILLTDCRRSLATSRDEVATLRAELQQCKDCQSLQKSNYELQIFRLQQDLDRRNTEIFSLRKDKEDFDYKLKVLESKKDRKIEELTQALTQSRNFDSDDTINLLKCQLEEMKFELENAQTLLMLQTERADLLSAAYDESNSEWSVIAQECQFILEERQATTTPESLTIDTEARADENDILQLIANVSLNQLDVTDLETAIISFTGHDSEPLVYENLHCGIDHIVKPLFDLLNENLEESKAAYEALDKETCMFFEDTADVRAFLAAYKKSQTEATQKDTDKDSQEINTSTTGLVNDKQEAFNIEKSALNERIKQLDEEHSILKQTQEVLEEKIEKLTGENNKMEQELAAARTSLTELQKSPVQIKSELVETLLGERLPDESHAMVKNESLHCSGMTTFMSATEGPSNIADVSQTANTTTGLVVDTVYTLPREHTRSLEDFAREFQEYLLENQVFHPEDNPPSDSSVFYFLLDRYLLLVDTYYNAKTLFEETLLELEEQDAKANIKKEALLSHISQLNLTGTTCDSSIDVSADMRSSTMCEGTNATMSDDTLCLSVVADATHDPLEFTMNSVMNTPSVEKLNTSTQKKTPASRRPSLNSSRRTSMNSSRIPTKATPAARSGTKPPRGLTTPLSRQSSTLNCTPELSMTPVQRVLRREPCSTAKKSVTFRSPLLARTAVEADNDRLKNLVEEKQATINSLEKAMDNRLQTISKLEEQITHLEECIAENRDLLERTETELTDRRDQLEKELEGVKTTLHTVTNKLLVEAINLDSSLEQRLRSEAPVKILTILLETIIKRFEKAQHTALMDFEKEREEWSTEMLNVAAESQKQQEKVAVLTNQIADIEKSMAAIQFESQLLEVQLNYLQEEKAATDQASRQQAAEFELELAGKDVELSSLEQQIQTLKAEVADLEKKATELLEEKNNLEKSAEEISSGEIESLKLALENSDREKDRLQSEVQKLAEIHNEVEDLKSLTTEKEAKITDLLQNVEDLKSQTANNEARITELLLSVEELSASKKAVEEEISGATKVLKDLSKFFCEELTGNLAEKLSAAYELVEERIEQLTENKDDESALITELKFNLEEVTSLKESLEKQIESKENEIQTLTAELAVARSEFDSKGKDLSDESKSLKESLAIKDEAVQELSAQIKGLEGEVAALKEEKSSVLEVSEVDSSKVTAMEKENQLILEKMQELKAVITKLETEVANHVEEKDQLHVMLKECETKICDLDTVRCSLEQQLAEREPLLEELETVKQTILEKTDEIAALETKLEAASQEKSELSAEIEALHTELKSMQSVAESLSQAQAELLKKDTEMSALLADKASVEEQLKEHMTAKEEYSVQMEAVKAEVATLKDSIDSLMKEKAERESKMSAEERSLANLQERLVAAQKEIAKYEDEKKSTEELLTTVRNDLASAEAKLNAATSRNAEFDAELNLLKAEVEENKKLIEKLTDELELLGLSKVALQNEKKRLTEELASARDGFLDEKGTLEGKILTLTELKTVCENEKEELNVKISELVSSNERITSENQEMTKKVEEVLESLESMKAEQGKEVEYWKGLKEACEELNKICESEKAVLLEKNIELANLNERVSLEKAGLSQKIIETEESLEVIKVEKTELLRKLEEMTKAGEQLMCEENKLSAKVTTLLESNFELESTKKALAKQVEELREIFQTKENDLASKLEASEQRISELLLQVEDYKSMEGAILRKLEEKQKSTENAFELKKQLTVAEEKLAAANSEAEKLNAEIVLLKTDLRKKTDLIKASELDAVSSNKEVRDLEHVVRDLQGDKERLSKDLEKKTAALDRRNQSMEDLAVKVKMLEGRESQLSREHDLQMKKISENNAELKALLHEVHKALGLPEEAVLNLTADTDSKAYLRMIKDNVQRNEKNKLTMQSEQEKLTVQVEKLTSEKVHFEIQAAELQAFGENQRQQIDTLTGKLSRLEERLGRKSRGGNDVIGSRRMEKLEEMNRTLHELLTQMLSTMQMPNAAKLRLISQREVDSATTHILQHAAKLAQAQEQAEALKEQIKDLDKENQELSDNVEVLLKDNSKLELEILDLKKGQRDGKAGACKACNDVKNSLKTKTELIGKLEGQISDLNDKIKDLDKENQELSDSVDALLKDNSKLELEILEVKQGVKKAVGCSSCNKLRNTVTSQDDEIAQLKTKCDDNSQCISELRDQISKLNVKCADLEGNVTDKEQQLYRALNSRMRGGGDDVRMSGMVREIDQGEKIRSLTKEKEMMKELLRQRTTTIKSLKAQLKEAGLDGGRSPMGPLNTNRMDSPIREKQLYNLRTRQETRRSRLSKHAIHVDIENIPV